MSKAPNSQGRFSHSRLSSFENCPRQYEYRYVQKIPREGESIEAFCGKRVHEILERLYHHMARHGRPPSLRQVLDRFRKDWDLRWHAGVEIVRDELDAAEYRARGARCLENYYRSYYPFDRDETVAIELSVELVLDAEGTYRGRGIIDRLVRTAPGCYEIHDYKTGAYLPPERRLEKDRQLALYQLGVEQTYGDVEQVELVWHYLLFNRTLRSTRTPDQLDGLREQTIDLIERIRATNDYPPRPGPLCPWCEYKGICPDAAVPLRADEPPALADAPPPPAEAFPGEAAPAFVPGLERRPHRAPVRPGPAAMAAAAPQQGAEQLDLFA